ncbi:response regulator [Mesobacillus subterraneus]|uniref:AraC family transcriptional regulator n=1 Tax=Mesobacillus subterraneus TaxID=285983 RepID=A0A0D6ZDS8_9BACI|nr:response regulator [Mesobacillus subterraneus]KIY23221.1 AraC family transcriptional regulator [Mesobacillus subterraneus]
MIKILIVDDEQIEREGMEAILNRAFPDLIIEQANNGNSAVELAASFKPDLVLMDVQMPGINGLEAVEQILAEFPQIKFIMVTAYDTFQYVQSALKLGAKDYILKPSKVSEIRTTIGKVLKEIENERELQAESSLQREMLQRTLALVETDVVTQLLFDHVHEVHLNMLLEMLEIQSTGQVFVMNVIVPEGMEHFYTKMKTIVRKTKSGWMGALYDGQLPIIIFRNGQSYRSQAISLARDILLTVNKEQKAGWFIGIGNVCPTLDKIRPSYQEAIIASSDRSLPVKYRFYQDIPVMNDSVSSQQVRYLKKDLSDQVRLGQWDQIKTNLSQLIHAYEMEGIEILQAQQFILAALWSIWSVINNLGIEAATPFFHYQASNYRHLRSETIHLLMEMKNSSDRHYLSLEADTIYQVKQYIMENSQQDISLETLSMKVGLSPIYISKMFKEKLGINYIDFLTECRIEKAKKMLADPEKSIKEITIEVGYHEPNYFSKVFKKLCNVTPREYRKALLGLKETER